MKLLSPICTVLLSVNVNVILGSSLRGGSMSEEDGRDLQTNTAFQGTASECDDGCLIGNGPPAPVCGVDGNTFINECLALCQGVGIARSGACPQAPLGDIKSYSSGRVTKEELNAFKANNFKLVSKRNLKFNLPKKIKEPSGDGKGGDGLGEQRTAKVSRVTAEGLEYVAEYSMDDIPAGIEYGPTEGGLPEFAGNSMDRLLTVIGVDTRVQQTGFDWPNWRLVQLDYRNSNGGYWGGCSGAIIGPSKVLTAAHCVFDNARKTWMLPARVAPGRYSGGDRWGQWDIKSGTIYTAWVNGDWEFDIAVLTISDIGSGFNSRIGDYMGYLGMRTQPCTYNENDWRITGYPGDKPAGTVWNTGVCDDWNYACGSRKIYHKCDTAGGMSGSSIRDLSSSIVAVHAYGGGDSGAGYNSGTAITSFHLGNIQYW